MIPFQVGPPSITGGNRPSATRECPSSKIVFWVNWISLKNHPVGSIDISLRISSSSSSARKMTSMSIREPSSHGTRIRWFGGRVRFNSPYLPPTRSSNQNDQVFMVVSLNSE